MESPTTTEDTTTIDTEIELPSEDESSDSGDED